MSESNLCAAIVGVPNVGKSTLINALIGEKIAITSPKPQTTRTRMLGVLTKGELQYVFLDTPGFHKPKTKLGEHMNKAVRESVADVDCVVFMTWAKDSFNEEEQKLLGEVKAADVPVVLCINKIDALKDREVAKKAAESLCGQFRFDDVVYTSALNVEGCDDMLATLAKYSVEGPHFYEDDMLTETPERDIVAELIRECLLTNLRDELPHGCAVSIESFKERPSGDFIDINAEIICEKESHKGMIIGKGGAMLKKIGSEARGKIEDFLMCRVNLKLWVKVREGWRDREAYIKSFGL